MTMLPACLQKNGGGGGPEFPVGSQTLQPTEPASQALMLCKFVISQSKPSNRPSAVSLAMVISTRYQSVNMHLKSGVYLRVWTFGAND